MWICLDHLYVLLPPCFSHFWCLHLGPALILVCRTYSSISISLCCWCCVVRSLSLYFMVSGLSGSLTLTGHFLLPRPQFLHLWSRGAGLAVFIPCNPSVTTPFIMECIWDWLWSRIQHNFFVKGQIVNILCSLCELCGLCRSYSALSSQCKSRHRQYRDE